MPYYTSILFAVVLDADGNPYLAKGFQDVKSYSGDPAFTVVHRKVVPLQYQDRVTAMVDFNDGRWKVATQVEASANSAKQERMEEMEMRSEVMAEEELAVLVRPYKR